MCFPRKGDLGWVLSGMTLSLHGRFTGLLG